MIRKDDDELTIEQERYVQGLYAGLSRIEAYKQSHNCENMTDETTDELARIMDNKKINHLLSRSYSERVRRSAKITY